MTRTTVALLLLVVSVAAGAQESRCADCHFANPSPAPEHVSDWQLSAHAAADVGCEQCHGGDPTTFERLQAHEGIRSGSDLESPVNYLNLPQTCGRCHTAQLEAFSSSRHLELLSAGDDSAPTCSTCHSDAGSFLLSSRGLQRTCNRCHGEDERAPRPGRPLIARETHDRIDTVRAQIDAAQKMIRRIRDDSRRSVLERRLEKARAPLTRAVQSAHSFTFEGFDHEIGQAAERLGRLIEDLANP